MPPTIANFETQDLGFWEIRELVWKEIKSWNYRLVLILLAKN